MEPGPKPDARSPRGTPPGPSEAKSSGSKVAYDANLRRIAAQTGVQTDELEDLRRLLWPERPPSGLLAPDPEEIPVYDPEALVW